MSSFQMHGSRGSVFDRQALVAWRQRFRQIDRNEHVAAVLLTGKTRGIDAAGEQAGVLKSWMLFGRDENQPVGYLWPEFARVCSESLQDAESPWAGCKRHSGIFYWYLSASYLVSRTALHYCCD